MPINAFYKPVISVFLFFVNTHLPYEMHTQVITVSNMHCLVDVVCI